jgi:LAO/AO transport system kinase
VTAHRDLLARSGALAAKRADQEVAWMWATVQDRVLARLRDHPGTRERVQGLEQDLRHGRTTATRAAQDLLGHLGFEA